MRSKIFVLLISVAIALLLAEVGLRVVGYHPSAMDPRMFVANLNPWLPYKLQPGYHGYYGGVEFQVDSYGNRLVAGEQHAASARRVVLLLGDSVVFGQGLRDSDTLASQLQRECQTQSFPYKIENIGVPGYSSWNEYAALTEFLKSRHATDVVLVFVTNDITFENDYFGIGKGQVASYSGPETKSQRVRRLLFSRLYVASLIRESVRSLSSKVSPASSSSPHFSLTNNETAVNHSVEALTRIKESCLQKGITFSVGIYRDISYFSDETGWLQYEKVITSKLGQSGIHSFILKSHTLGLNASEVSVSWNDPHPSAKAVQLMARDILSQLQTQKPKIGLNHSSGRSRPI